MDHKFEVGKEYSNRNGRYQVLSIEEPKMRIRYEDGREDNVTIAIQARIWQAIRDETQQPKPAGKKGKKPTKGQRAWTRRGYAFKGLLQTDFKNDIAGTDWRRRESLGGLVALQLSETSSQFFQSHAVSRRPAVHVYLPDHFDPANGVPYAKYNLRLSPDDARFGFYIERPDGTRNMDNSWHWWPFLQALETDDQLQKQLLTAMQVNDLNWLLQLEKGEGNNYKEWREIKVIEGQPLLWDEKEDIEWAEFVNRLRAFSSDLWLNIHLCKSTEKQVALAAGPQFADKVSAVFQSTLPLYLACIETAQR